MKESLQDTIFKRVIFEGEVGSTNDLAMGLLESEGESGLVILADSQSSGRGRLGRTWYSPPGKNIYMSLVLRPDVPLSEAPILTIMTGVAVCFGVKKTVDADINLKWPNDIIFSGSKLGGILIETKVKRARVSGAVVGIGINVNTGIGEFPKDIEDIATSVFIETGIAYDKNEIAFFILKEFDALYRDVLIKDTDGNKMRTSEAVRKKIIKSWRDLDITIGKRVSVVTSNETVNGKALDIDEMCRLKIETNGGDVRHIHSGDVTILK